MLAQILNDQSIDKMAEKFGEASAAAAASAPTNWVQMLASLCGFLALCWVVRQFLLENRENRSERRDFSETIKGMMSTSADRYDTARRECHAHSVSMSEHRERDTASLQDVTKDLKDVTKDVKVSLCKVEGVVHEVKQVVTQSHEAVAKAMEKLSEK